MTNIINLNKPKKKSLEIVDIPWQTYRNVSIGIIFISIFLIAHVKKIIENEISDKYINMVINIVLVFFVFNLCIFLFYKTYHRYITTKKGEKGTPGQRGTRGISGKNSCCDITVKKTGNFTRDKNIIKKEIIDIEDNTEIDFNKLKKSENLFSKSVEPQNKIIGNNITITNENKYKYTNSIKSKENKPIIGAVVNYNKNTKKIMAIQYLVDGNKKHNKKSYFIKTLGESKDTIGDYKNQSKNVERTNFNCPANSAIYKVEGMYDERGIRGIKFFCQDLKSGKLVKSYNNKNKRVYGVVFGMNPKPGDDNYRYDKIQCNLDKNYKPSFISTVGGVYDKNKKSIENLEFSECSKFGTNN
jgi:hypothetical protein